MKRGNTIVRTIKTVFDLRDANNVEVKFSQKGRVVLTKTGDQVLVGENSVQIVLSQEETLLFEPGRFIPVEINGYYDEGTKLTSNVMYRPFDGTLKGDNMDAGFGEVNVIVSERQAERIWNKIEDIDEVDERQDGTLSEHSETIAEHSETLVTHAAAIANKVDKVEGKGLSTNDYTDTEKAKLEGIEAGAEVNVQADYAEADTSEDDYIKNKPDDLSQAEIQNIIDSLL